MSKHSAEYIHEVTARLQKIMAGSDGMVRIRCGCAACRVAEHASYCAVHNAPALPIGKCNCGAEQR